MQANVEAVRVAGLVTTLVSMAGDNRRMDSLPNSVGPRVCISICTFSRFALFGMVSKVLITDSKKYFFLFPVPYTVCNK